MEIVLRCIALCNRILARFYPMLQRYGSLARPRCVLAAGTVVEEKGVYDTMDAPCSCQNASMAASTL